MPSIYQPRRPRASPLWHLVHHGWNDFLAEYEKRYRKDLGPLHPAALTTVESFLRCGDLASGFTRLQCPDCGHERLLAFTCKTRHFCPSCHHSSLPGRKLRMPVLRSPQGEEGAGQRKANGCEECPS